MDISKCADTSYSLVFQGKMDSSLGRTKTKALIIITKVCVSQERNTCMEMEREVQP